ncbi:hypothetical protein QBC45DRAFT_402062 [Copromyces sp. CBS 386.78]|nr:hypothetical protein QBC45DRAFT_402062 [Copromyces sp. CBS 386.78]
MGEALHMVAVNSAVGIVWFPGTAVAVTLMSVPAVFGVLSTRVKPPKVEAITTRPYARLRQEKKNSRNLISAS